MRTLISLMLFIFCGLAHAAPVNVIVTNDAISPVPVNIQNPPTVMCTYNPGWASGNTGPFTGYAMYGNATGAQCPNGVEKIKVQRIGFSPDVGPTTEQSSNVEKYRASVGYQLASQNPPFPPLTPAGLLAVVTDGAPVTDVLQEFILDTTDADLAIYLWTRASSGIDGVPPVIKGTILFVGTPMP